jgi:hypothetical protein
LSSRDDDGREREMDQPDKVVDGCHETPPFIHRVDFDIYTFLHINM